MSENNSSDKNINRNVNDKMDNKTNKQDNAYYLWFKDSTSSEKETQTLSYEYELMYQAQKESEYRSNIKIYVAAFILVFAGLLALLIFSPVIYKIFF
jgi:predicted phage-related endonuclease